MKLKAVQSRAAFCYIKEKEVKNMNKELSMAIIRLIITAVLMVNAALTAKGMNPIPFDETAFTEWATYIVTGLSTIWAWWKNNNVTKTAQEAQAYLDAIKNDEEENND